MSDTENTFQLDERLATDTYPVCEFDDFYLRLHKNALIPWLILVPKTQKVELFACDKNFRVRIRQALDELAIFSQNYFRADKINIATLGNVVSQLHIHIVARHTNDFAWPDPIWGKTHFLAYDNNKKNAIINDTKAFLNSILEDKK